MTALRYRNATPKARLVPLSPSFLEYLHADGIVLPSDDRGAQRREWSDTDSGIFSASEAQDSSDDDDLDVAAGWRNIHDAIQTTIADLGGKVMPKLNWSAPKDATWINSNTMECRTANEVYLLLKSSDFITHDLEHAFDDTADDSLSKGGQNVLTQQSIPYFLVLRKTVEAWNPSVEFRCFVRKRILLCISQRDLNHYDFLQKMSAKLTSLIETFFDTRLGDTFEDENFVFDVYVPPPYDRVWLVDINPWAPRTDPLLFSWMEILGMPEQNTTEEVPEIVRLSLNQSADIDTNGTAQMTESALPEDESLSDGDIDEEIFRPEFRLVQHSDPEALNFNSPQYSAHKLPRDIVDASQSGEGLREFARDWQEILAKRQRDEEGAESSSAHD